MTTVRLLQISSAAGLLLLFSLTVPFAQADGHSDPSHGAAYAYFLEALADRSAGNLDAAADLLKKALALDSHSITILEELAELAIHTGDLEQAGRWAEKALNLEPDNIDMKILLAQIYSNQGRTNEAMDILSEVLDERPDDQEALFLLGTIYAQSKDYPQAIDALEKAAKQGGRRSFMAHYYLGRLYKDTGNLTQAEEHLREALQLNPRLGAVYFDLADVYARRGDIGKAEEQYRILLREEPSNLKARELLFRLLISEKRLKDALAELRELRSAVSNDSGISLRIAILLIQLEQYDEALKVLDEMAQSNPGDNQILLYMAVIKERQSDPEGAIKLLRAIKGDSELAVDARARLAFLLKETGAVSEALKVLEDGLRQRPGTKEWVLALSSLYEEAHRIPEAETLLRNAVEENPLDRELLFSLVMILDKMGQRQEAVEFAKKALEVDADYVPALNYLGYTYAEEGINLEEAERLVAKALSQEPDDGYITDSMGWVYYKKGEFDKAISYLEKARELTPEDPIIAEHLGDAFMAKRLFYRALKTYREVMELEKESGRRFKLRRKIREAQDAISDMLDTQTPFQGTRP
jgi:tetratricopeptide (TPR) repeat protein